MAARALPPFVIYENRAYSGFEVELVRLVAAKLGMSVEIYAVDTVAKQIDDISRGVARLGLGGVAITESREEVVDFSLPVLDSGLTILTTTDDSRGIGGRMLSPRCRRLIGSALAAGCLRRGRAGLRAPGLVAGAP